MAKSPRMTSVVSTHPENVCHGVDAPLTRDPGPGLAWGVDKGLLNEPGRPRLTRGWVIALALLGLFVLIALGNSDEDPSTGSASSRSESESSSRLACTHFRNIAGDAELMTDTEIRSKMKEVHDDASIATPQVQSASRDALAAITSGNTENFRAAIQRLDSACDSAGW